MITLILTKKVRTRCYHVTAEMIRLGLQGSNAIPYLILHSIYCNSRDDSPRDLSITLKSVAQYTRSEGKIGIFPSKCQHSASCTIGMITS